MGLKAELGNPGRATAGVIYCVQSHPPTALMTDDVIITLKGHMSHR